MQMRLQENTPSDATAPCSAIPVQPRQNMIFHPKLSNISFFSYNIFIHIPQKCTGTLSTLYRSSPSAGDTQYSHFVLKWPN